jgi:hypothetical protein
MKIEQPKLIIIAGPNVQAKRRLRVKYWSINGLKIVFISIPTT